jgi:hypothetical protein
MIEGEPAALLLRQLKRACAVAVDAGAVIVSGGTDAGVFHLLGFALSSTTRKPPAVVGVVPEAHVSQGGRSEAAERFPLAPSHTGFVLVPGTWGDETRVLSRLVSLVADDRPAVILLAGGGEIASRELVEHLRLGRAIVVLEGSGRLADQVVALTRAATRDTLQGLPDDLGPLLAAGSVYIVGGPHSEVRLEKRLRGLLRPVRRPLRQRVPMLSVFPRLRSADATDHLLDPSVVVEHPRLANRISELNRVVLPAFVALDGEANHEQNRHRWFTVLAILGGLLTTMFGSLGAWLRSVPWPGIVVAALGATTSAVTTMARRQGSLQVWLDARIRAERLRSLYFEALASKGPLRDERIGTTLEQEVADIQYGALKP